MSWAEPRPSPPIFTPRFTSLPFLKTFQPNAPSIAGNKEKGLLLLQKNAPGVKICKSVIDLRQI